MPQPIDAAAWRLYRFSLAYLALLFVALAVDSMVAGAAALPAAA